MYQNSLSDVEPQESYLICVWEFMPEDWSVEEEDSLTRRIVENYYGQLLNET